jgi:Uma2 family endonuclease
MVHAPIDDAHAECLHLPRGAVAFPIRLRIPPGFRPEDPSTWPQLEGRLELVEGRIEYLPPCGGVQQDVVADLVGLLLAWRRSRPEFVVGANEAGMALGGEVRAADAAVWRAADLGASTHQLRRVPFGQLERG